MATSARERPDSTWYSYHQTVGWPRLALLGARRGAPVGAALVVAAVAIAYASLKLHDEPVRRWLSRRLIKHVDRSPLT